MVHAAGAEVTTMGKSRESEAVGTAGKFTLLLAGLSLLVASPAWGHSQIRVDADDVEGPLDVVEVRQNHQKVPPRTIRLRLTTYETWESQVLERSSSNERRFVSFEFDTDGDTSGDAQRRVVIRYVDGQLEAGMYADGTSGDPLGPPMASVGVRRPDEHSVKVWFPRRLLGKGIRTYSWRTTTSFEAENDPTCPKPEGPYDGGHGTCADFTPFERHSFRR